MPRCIRCDRPSWLPGRLGLDRSTRRCRSCQREVAALLPRFRGLFLEFASDGLLTPHEWARLRSACASERLSFDEALRLVRDDALNLMWRTLAFAFADEEITGDEESDLHRLRHELRLPLEVTKPIFEQLAYLRQLGEIRRGRLPRVRPTSGTRLQPDEWCHLEMRATFERANGRGARAIEGRLLATSRKLLFLSPSGGFELAWNKIARLARMDHTLVLELSSRTGNGHYHVADGPLAEAVLDTLIKIANREVVAPQADRQSRHIPHAVKLAVWQRDGGRCVACEAGSYLEFDHIIPHSKGGANTLDNVQLLCRGCNLHKRDRI